MAAAGALPPAHLRHRRARFRDRPHRHDDHDGAGLHAGPGAGGARVVSGCGRSLRSASPQRSAANLLIAPTDPETLAAERAHRAIAGDRGRACRLLWERAEARVDAARRLVTAGITRMLALLKSAEVVHPSSSAARPIQRVDHTGRPSRHRGGGAGAAVDHTAPRRRARAVAACRRGLRAPPACARGAPRRGARTARGRRATACGRRLGAVARRSSSWSTSWTCYTRHSGPRPLPAEAAASDAEPAPPVRARRIHEPGIPSLRAQRGARRHDLLRPAERRRLARHPHLHHHLFDRRADERGRDDPEGHACASRARWSAR